MSLTNDTLFNGRLVCQQHRNGYRFSLDAVLLAHFCQPASGARILDLGTGCGVIGLVLCYRYPDIQVTGLELQPALAELAQGNIRANSLEDRFSVEQGDFRKIKQKRQVQAESYDLVLSNPPYHKVGCGRISREDECALARHELTADPDAVMAAAAFAVKNRGTVTCIYPAERLATVTAVMMNKRLILKRIQPVYSSPQDHQARLVMLEAIKNGGEGLCLLPPLYIYQYPDGPYSEEVAAMYAG
ncbi:MAG: methyltransferase domain-containing protein [Candidatus Electrothrix sp. AW5]|nr:methyltransferase domain-containing protein [Candidatus Electrothrix gigas]MCI5197578.1 methyltransferase domain-containing protein [Candidatus Electrothrix gigas]